jgi:hypothetical protein
LFSIKIVEIDFQHRVVTLIFRRYRKRSEWEFKKCVGVINGIELVLDKKSMVSL